MLRFTLKTVLLISILFIGILIGMQEANNGLLRVTGYDDPRFEPVIEMNKQEDGQIETTIMGETITSHNLDEKKKVIEEMNANHFLTEISRGITDFISNLVTSILPS